MNQYGHVKLWMKSIVSFMEDQVAWWWMMKELHAMGNFQGSMVCYVEAEELDDDC